MTPRQQKRYFYEWGRVRDVRKAKGLPCTDTLRHELHLKALGVRKSSKDFTNADLDKVLATFRAITEPGNLKAQLHALDQPDLRRADSWKRIAAILEDLKIGNQYAYDQSDLEGRRMKYLSGIITSICPGKTHWDQLTDAEAAKLLGVMQRRQMYVHRQRQKHATPAPSEAENCPF